MLWQQIKWPLFFFLFLFLSHWVLCLKLKLWRRNREKKPFYSAAVTSLPHCPFIMPSPPPHPHSFHHCSVPFYLISSYLPEILSFYSRHFSYLLNPFPFLLIYLLLSFPPYPTSSDFFNLFDPLSTTHFTILSPFILLTSLSSLFLCYSIFLILLFSAFIFIPSFCLLL